MSFGKIFWIVLITAILVTLISNIEIEKQGKSKNLEYGCGCISTSTNLICGGADPSCDEFNNRMMAEWKQGKTKEVD